MNTDEMGKEIGTESNTANKSRYYAEGIIRELWIADNKANTPDKGTAIETEVRFTLTPDKEYAIEAECNGEKKTCVVFWPSDFTKDIFADKENVNKGIYFLAKSLEKMSECTAVYFCRGARAARGCRIERAVAEAYGLTCIDEPEESKEETE